MSYNNVVDSILMAFNGEFGNDSNEELMNSVEYKEYGYRIIDCPVCRQKTMDMFAICSGCGWEYDIFINYDEDEAFSDCNGTTFGEYKNAYRILRDAFDKRKNGELEKFYIITCYSRDIPEFIPSSRTYGAFDSFEACRKALNENSLNMHFPSLDFAVAESIDMESNVEEIKWFVWNEQSQDFLETEQKADWSNGWVNFALE